MITPRRITTQKYSQLTWMMIILVCINMSCSHEIPDSRAIPMNYSDIPISELKQQALSSGNIEAYQELSIVYLDLPRGDFLDIALEMANRHKHPQAYYDVYYQLLKSTKRKGTTLSLDSCDEITRKLALKYLNTAFEQCHEQAFQEFGNLYSEGIFPKKDSFLGQKFLRRYDSLIKVD